MELTDKITSREAYEAVCQVLRGRGVYLSAPPGVRGYTSTVPLEMPWWLARDYLRISQGVYAVSDTLVEINATFAGQYCVHISTEDTDQIAYTPDASYGEQDKRLRCSLGSFLKKRMPLLTERYIQRLVAEHQAEIKVELLFARTVAEVEKVYTTMVGDTGCMRYNAKHFGLGEGLHPSHIYASPGFAVAYTLDEGGNIVSRAVTWVNPDDPTDKRFIRIYGSRTLRYALTRAGYQLNNFASAELQAIPITARKDSYVMPYLDGVDGKQDDRNGTYVTLTDRGTFKLLTVSQYEVLKAQYNEIPHGAADDSLKLCKNQDGYITIQPPPARTYICAITGEEVDIKASGKPVLVYFNGVIGKVRSTVENLARFCMSVYVNRTQIARVEPAAVKTFEHDRGHWLDTPENRAHLGYAKLSEAHYGLDQWAVKTCQLSDGQTIRTEDAVSVLPFEGQAYLIHKSKLAETRKEGYFNRYSTDGIKRIIHKARLTLARSNTGVYFDTELDNVSFTKLTFSDEYVNVMKVRRFSLFGQRVYAHKSMSFAELIGSLTDQQLLDYAKKTPLINLEDDLDDNIRSILNTPIPYGNVPVALRINNVLRPHLRILLSVGSLGYRWLYNGWRFSSDMSATVEHFRDTCDHFEKHVAIENGLSDEFKQIWRVYRIVRDMLKPYTDAYRMLTTECGPVNRPEAERLLRLGLFGEPIPVPEAVTEPAAEAVAGAPAESEVQSTLHSIAGITQVIDTMMSGPSDGVASFDAVDESSLI